MPKFIAFKLKDGESFYTETRVNNRTISVLVDGGDDYKIFKRFSEDESRYIEGTFSDSYTNGEGQYLLQIE